MTDNSNNVPDYLLSALEIEQVSGSTDLFSDVAASTPKLRRVEIPQRNSTKHAGNIGKIYISGEDANTEGTYVDHLDFLLVESFIWDRSPDNQPPDRIRSSAQAMATLPLGGRTMWAFADDGRRVTDVSSPVCSSPNGVEVWKNTIGKDVYDYRTKENVKIGFQKGEDGLQHRMEFSCIGCPFARKVEVPTGKTLADGTPEVQSFSAMCRETHSYLIWAVDQKELMTIKGVNLGMQIALAGSYSQAGRRFDGTPFAGIKQPFAHTGMVMSADGKAKVAAFRNRPQGKPTPQNPSAPVYAVRMSVTLNSFSPSTLVPQFTVLNGAIESIAGVNPKSKVWTDGSVQVPTPERKLDIAEYVAFLGDMQTVINDDYKSRFMAVNLIDGGGSSGIAEALPQANVAGSLPAQAASAPKATNFDDPFGFQNT